MGIDKNRPDLVMGKLSIATDEIVDIYCHSFMTGELSDLVRSFKREDYDWMNFLSHEAIDHFCINSEYGHAFRK